MSFFERFRRGEDGTIAVIAAIVSSIIFLAVGLSVDYGRGIGLRKDLQNIADASALHGGKLYQSGVALSAVETEVKRFAVDQASAKGIEIDVGDVNVDIDQQADTVKTAIDTELGTTMMRVASFDVMDVGSSAKVALARNGDERDVELIMVLDVSGSMGGRSIGTTDSKIEVLRTAAKDLAKVTLQVNDLDLDANNRVGIVPFAHSVNLGDLYFDRAAQKHVNNGASHFDTKKLYWYRDGNGNRQDAPQRFDSNGRLKTWIYGCFAARNSFQIKSVCANNPDNYTREVRPCVVERNNRTFGGANPSNANNRFGAHGHQMWLHWSYLAYCMQDYASVMPLTAQLSELETKIDGLEASGGTQGHLGLQWGWYMLRSNWANFWKNPNDPVDPNRHAPKGKNSPDARKIMVFMTDGVFWDRAYNELDEDGQATGKGSITEQALKFCKKIKSYNTELYTVAYEMNDPEMVQALKDCATSEDKHFKAASDNEELIQFFRAIGFELTKLRVVE
ncbi:MAG: TadE/TadG family type IV pilus assembly protein [Pseudomonadota bacterium]